MSIVYDALVILLIWWLSHFCMEQIWKSLEDVKKMMEMIYGTREFMGHMDDCRTLLPISVGHLNVVESLQP